MDNRAETYLHYCSPGLCPGALLFWNTKAIALECKLQYDPKYPHVSIFLNIEEQLPEEYSLQRVIFGNAFWTHFENLK